MKKSLLLLVPLMVLVGCSINGLNPFGGSNNEGGALGDGMATLAVQVIEPDKGTIDVDELNITNANFRLIDVLAQTQTTNWAPGLSGYILFNPIRPGLTSLRLIDVDVLGYASTNATNITVRAGYNYRIVVSLGGMIYMIETNASGITVSNYLAVYSQTHAVPALNNAFNPLNGGNLFIWTPCLTLTEITTNPWEGTQNWQLTRTASTSNWIGFGISITNGAKDKSIYSGGHLRFAVKAYNSNNTYKVGIQSITGAVTNDAFVNLADIPGFAVDGAWHALSVPMSSFTGINFAGVYAYFYIASINLQTNTNTYLYLDDIYWSRD